MKYGLLMMALLLSSFALLSSLPKNDYDFDILGYFEFHTRVKKFDESKVVVKLIPIAWELIDYKALICIDKTEKKFAVLIIPETKIEIDTLNYEPVEYNSKFYDMEIIAFTNTEDIKAPYKERLNLDSRYDPTDPLGEFLGLFYKGKKIKIMKHFQNPREDDYRFYIQTFTTKYLIYYNEKIYYQND